MQQTKAERLFSGSIGQEYDMLKVICPSAAKVSHKQVAWMKRSVIRGWVYDKSSARQEIRVWVYDDLWIHY